jgi:hypothetical protein
MAFAPQAGRGYRRLRRGASSRCRTLGEVMPAPLALPPLAWAALRLGAVAAVVIYAARSRASQPKVAEHEHVLDSVDEGFTAVPHRAEAERAVNARGRLRRVVRLGSGGPGVEIDAAGLVRFRIRRA